MIQKTIQISEKQKEFVRRHKLRHCMIHMIRIFLFALFLMIWEFASRNEIIDPFFFSSPSGLIICLADQISDNALFMHFMITLGETIISFISVMLFSILIAVFLWYFTFAADIADPFLVILNSLPKSALAPLFIVWLGSNRRTIIIAGISVAVFGSILNIYTGFKQADPEKVKLVRLLGGNKLQCFTKVVLPSSLPNLMSIAKVNIGLSLVGVIIGEFLAAREGLGYLIIYGTQVFKLDMVILSILLLCIMAFGLYALLQLLEHQMKKRKLYE